MNMLFYFEFSHIQKLLNIHTNELLFCKLISNTIYMCVCVFACTCINMMSNVIFAPLNSDLGSAIASTHAFYFGVIVLFWSMGPTIHAKEEEALSN